MQSDVTQSETFYKIWAWFDVHKKHVLWTAVVIVIVGIGAGFFLWQQNAREADANEALSKTISGEAFSGQRAPSAQDLLNIASDYRGTRAGARAQLLGGSDLFMQGKYAEARAQFEKYLRENREGAFIAQARFGIAACLEAEGKTDAATAAYKDIVDHYGSENVTPQANVALGRLAETQGKLEQARDYYFKAAGMDSGIVGAEARMRLQNLIAKHPEIVPSQPAPAPSITTTNAPSTNVPALTLPDAR